jgi:RNase adapter protein RapZ
MTTTRFVLVTGLSGAGKSQAMKSFEDLGYYCLDHLPAALVADLVTLIRRAEISRVALSLDTRVGGAFGNPLDALEQLSKLGIAYEVLYLEASDDALVRRYSETRRRHPLEDAGNLGDAIASERAELAVLRERATLVLDTSDFTQGSLKARIVAAYGDDSSRRKLTVHVVAFGYKFGVPRDADLVFDVRFLPNPNYVPELKKLCGDDAPVAAFMEAIPETELFLGHLFGMIDFLVPLYIGEGKSRLTVAIGCTGGRHRSVYIANRLSDHLRLMPGLVVASEQRELASA